MRKKDYYNGKWTGDFITSEILKYLLQGNFLSPGYKDAQLQVGNHNRRSNVDKIVF